MPTKKQSFSDISDYRNTEVTETEHGWRVRLYNTRIFSLDYSKGTLYLNHGGWKTDTTKRRINECLLAAGLPYSILQEDFTWYVYKNGERQQEFPWPSLTLDL